MIICAILFQTTTIFELINLTTISIYPFHFQCWQTSVDPFVLEHMPPALIRRQEAIHELLQGEKELVEDLGLVVKVSWNVTGFCLLSDLGKTRARTTLYCKM